MNLRRLALALICVAGIIGAAGSAAAVLFAGPPAEASASAAVEPSVPPTIAPPPEPPASPAPTPKATVAAAPLPQAAVTAQPTPTPIPVQSSRRVVVSISQQHMWAYDGDRLVADSDVATGRAALPTPTGLFHVMSRHSPYTMISPWPLGSPYYYPPSSMNYAVEFAPGGYFLHDAPWRSTWGQGANRTDGTHGCVNIPGAPMGAVYRWIRLGDEVDVNP